MDRTSARRTFAPLAWTYHPKREGRVLYYCMGWTPRKEADYYQRPGHRASLKLHERPNPRRQHRGLRQLQRRGHSCGHQLILAEALRVFPYV